jgi:hypothetical protein
MRYRHFSYSVAIFSLFKQLLYINFTKWGNCDISMHACSILWSNLPFSYSSLYLSLLSHSFLTFFKLHMGFIRPFYTCNTYNVLQSYSQFLPLFSLYYLPLVIPQQSPLNVQGLSFFYFRSRLHMRESMWYLLFWVCLLHVIWSSLVPSIFLNMT